MSGIDRLVCYEGYYLNRVYQDYRPNRIHVFVGKSKVCKCGKEVW